MLESNVVYVDIRYAMYVREIASIEGCISSGWAKVENWSIIDNDWGISIIKSNELFDKYLNVYNTVQHEVYWSYADASLMNQLVLRKKIFSVKISISLSCRLAYLFIRLYLFVAKVEKTVIQTI